MAKRTYQASKSFIEQSDSSHGYHKLKPFRLEGCIRLKVGRAGVQAKVRDFTLCATGGHGHGAQLQVLTPGSGSKELIIGDVRKACRITGWPSITYASDYSPEAIASIRDLHGSRRRRR